MCFMSTSVIAGKLYNNNTKVMNDFYKNIIDLGSDIINMGRFITRGNTLE